MFYRGRWAWLDLRPWGGGKIAARDPSHPDWPRSGCKTEREDVARKWGWSYVSLLNQNGSQAITAPRISGRLLKYAIPDYLAEREAMGKASSTLIGDRNALKHLIEWAGCDQRVDKIHVTPNGQRPLFVLYLQDFVRHLTTQGYEPSTIGIIVGKVRPFFKSVAPHLNFDALELPEVISKEARSWTDDELVKIRDAADQWDREYRPENYPFARTTVELFLATGARQQEGFALQWRDINVSNYTIRFTQQYCRINNTLMPLKSKQARVALILPSWWDRYDLTFITKRGIILAPTWPNDTMLAAGAQRRMLSGRTRDGVHFPGILDLAGLNEDGVAYHSFRHTYARIFLESGGTMEQLQGSLGHSSIVTTEREYGHYSQDKRAAGARSRIYAPNGSRSVA